MPATNFNSLGGFSVGIPAIQIVDVNGNIVSNVNTTGNVTANNIYSSNYFLANGLPLVSGNILYSTNISTSNITLTANSNIVMSSGRITVMSDPINPTDGATKNYVDNLIANLQSQITILTNRIANI